MKYGQDFKVIAHTIDEQLAALRAKLQRENETFPDTLPVEQDSAFDPWASVPEAKKQEIKRDKWHRDLGEL
jgi:hypothetical protein